MATRYYTFKSLMSEVERILGGAASAVSYDGRTETYRRGDKSVVVERMFMFDDDAGENIYDLQLEA